ncbi:(4Fe-4S)-binding protein [Micromonospora inaquosa]|uniref:(4Fe-4S)-binding protein n=1 Tax=Micromonospora inaquosa TaxID=2203716 RepID=UPI001ABEF6F0|nr:(4Fe-4S)-binding protein [Micromonospora inaquosa]
MTVTFEARRCWHAAECVRGLPEVFDTGQRPWIRPDGANTLLRPPLRDLILLTFAGALDRMKEVGTVDRVTVTCSHPTPRASRI